jgi:DNA-binding protein HU-beta
VPIPPQGAPRGQASAPSPYLGVAVEQVEGAVDIGMELMADLADDTGASRACGRHAAQGTVAGGPPLGHFVHADACLFARTPQDGAEGPGVVKEQVSPGANRGSMGKGTWEVGAVTKAQFAARLAERLKVSKAEATRALDEMVGSLIWLLKRGDKVRFPGFGTFRVLKRKARVARNPRTGEPVRVPARTVPRFTPARELKEAVKRA